MEIKDKIQMLRKQRGLTYEQVGNMVGVGKSTVRKWESGAISNMRRDKIDKLAGALGTSPAYLMGWTDDPNVQQKAPMPDGMSARDPETETLIYEIMDRMNRLPPSQLRKAVEYLDLLLLQAENQDKA